MKKFIFLSFLFCATTLFGQDVSESLAVDIATQYYERVKDDNVNEQVLRIKANNQIKGKRAPELISPLGLANMWLVPVEDGWVLVSTNTKTTPVLAHYRTDRKPAYDSLAPGAKYLLEWYEHEIAYANDSCPNCERNWKWNELRQENETKNVLLQNTRGVFLPLPAHWNQIGNESNPPDCDKSYNKFCPVVNNNNASGQCYKAAVGCVAVAMAQIMAYWHWPYAANVPTTPGGNTTELKFYDWTMMPYYLYNYTHDNEVDMVAGLLRDCGYMSDMNYGVGSGTTDEKALAAFVAFGYNGNTIQKKDKWLTSGWQTMLQAELNAGRPVYYGGYSSGFWTNGHAFVLDGYDSQGYFHINFGYGTTGGDDYYQIDSISANGTNYNHWQSAIIGIQPAPYCGSATIDETVIFPSKFSITTGGELIFEEKVLENIERGEIYSATQVRLTNGFTIKEGCNVHIAIKDVPCPTETLSIPAIQVAPMKKTHSSNEEQIVKKTLTLSPNPVASMLHIQTQDELSQAKIYTINGQRVLQASQADIDVSALPQGMYILRAETTDGNAHQTKFIKQ